jgi:mono/diheme cytochrome c family protein
MPYGFPTDPEVAEGTTRMMQWGLVLMLALVAAFPLYRWFEPDARAEARESHQESLAASGGDIWQFNCAACHGVDGEGGVGPALNSAQFLQSATDDQIKLLVSVGIPGTAMSAFSLDYGGPLTSEQIRSVVAFIRSWEPDAPDRPDWRETSG